MTTDNEWNLIYSYTRQQAIEDGVLIDVTDAARGVGFKVNTVVTATLFHGYVEPPTGLEGEGQSTAGRLHDLLFLVLCAARKNHAGADRATVRVAFLMAPGKTETVEVIAHIGPGDQGEPVLTLMLHEDD
ncbi:hypothetical protein GTA51_10055 [Desulfovibrio aerotolerans]|uniref:Uncharacterized protein n=1 Tax=Solidesulfovibrio aerotolerans TaxID=295255 RepID=A0A7C9MIV1_9BACT|nr:DUF6573 family protein [Solidesulfovibrio aerotolerans]MYL83468.1 hypothetical protein [Solidesulfovibrio aerotolerans]